MQKGFNQLHKPREGARNAGGDEGASIGLGFVLPWVRWVPWELEVLLPMLVFIPLRRKQLDLHIQHLLHEASCCPARLGTAPWLSPSVPGCSPRGAGWGRARCDPAQARTHSRAHSGPAHAPSTKIKLNYWPPAHLEQNFCPSQQFKVSQGG